MSSEAEKPANIYEIYIDVKSGHIDDLRHVNNLVYLQWAQEVAGAHWQQESTDEEQRKYRWVVLRHEVNYYKPAFLGEKLTARTWVEKMEGVKSFRHVEIRRDDQVLVKAVTAWAMIDAETGRPSRVPHEMAARFL